MIQSQRAGRQNCDESTQHITIITPTFFFCLLFFCHKKQGFKHHHIQSSAHKSWYLGNIRLINLNQKRRDGKTPLSKPSKEMKMNMSEMRSREMWRTRFAEVRYSRIYTRNRRQNNAIEDSEWAYELMGLKTQNHNAFRYRFWIITVPAVRGHEEHDVFIKRIRVCS